MWSRLEDVGEGVEAVEAVEAAGEREDMSSWVVSEECGCMLGAGVSPSEMTSGMPEGLPARVGAVVTGITVAPTPTVAALSVHDVGLSLE